MRPTNAINNRAGNKLTESRQIQSRWKEYIEDLYNKPSKPYTDEMKPASVAKDSMGLDILYDKFQKAVSEALGCKGKHELFEMFGLQEMMWHT